MADEQAVEEVTEDQIAEDTSTEGQGGEDDESMEDILHSIRDIIADTPDEVLEESADEKSPDDDSDVDDDDDILELTEMIEEVTEEPSGEDKTNEEPKKVAEEETAKSEDNKAEAEEDASDVLADIDEALEEDAVEETPVEEAAVVEETPVEEAAVVEETPAEEAAVEETPAEEVDKNDEESKHLVSDGAAKVASASIKNLMNNLPKEDIQSPDFRGGNTVEDLVVETLKPMLSAWLDKNLPTIVEDLVSQEIKKIVPHASRD